MVQRKTLTQEETIELETSETTATRLPNVEAVCGGPTFIVKRAFVVAANSPDEAISRLEAGLEDMAKCMAILQGQIEDELARAALERPTLQQENDALVLPPLFGTSKRGPQLPS